MRYRKDSVNRGAWRRPSRFERDSLLTTACPPSARSPRPGRREHDRQPVGDPACQPPACRRGRGGAPRTGGPPARAHERSRASASTKSMPSQPGIACPDTRGRRASARRRGSATYIGMTTTRVVRKAIARRSGTCSAGRGGRPSDTSTTTIIPPTSRNAASRWTSRIQFQSVGRIAASIYPAPGLKTIRTRIAMTPGEAQVVEDERAAVGDGARAAPRSAGRPRPPAARRARVAWRIRLPAGPERAPTRPRARSPRCTQPLSRCRAGVVLGEPDPEDERRRSTPTPIERRPSAAPARAAVRSRSACRGASPASGASRRRPPRRGTERRRGCGAAAASRTSSRRGSLRRRPAYNRRMDARERHLRLLTETIAAVNSTLDLQEVLELVATQRRRRARHRRLLRLPVRRARRRARAARDARDAVEEMTRRPKMRPGEGITGAAAAERRAGDDPRAGAPRPAVQAVPEPARGGVRVDPRRADPRAREARGRAERPHARAARVLASDEIDLLLAIAAQVAQSIEHAKLYSHAQRRVEELEALARISEAVSESLYLEESLEAIVKTTMDAVVGDRAPRSCSRTARSRGPRAGRASTRCARRCAGSAAQIGELVADRDTPFTDEERAAALRRSPTTRRSRSSTAAR